MHLRTHEDRYICVCGMKFHHDKTLGRHERFCKEAADDKRKKLIEKNLMVDDDE